MKPKFILALLIFLEIVLILILGLFLLHVLTAKPTRPTFISKENVVFTVSSQLKYFYELNPDSKEVFVPDWLGYKPNYRVNSDTLNERFDYETLKPKGVFRIVSLGDSWTFGQLVDTKDNYSEILEDKLNKLSCQKYQKFEVINLGVFKYDIRYEVERFKVRGQKYQPDLVIWHLNNINFQTVNEFVFKRHEQLQKELTNVADYQIWIKALKDQNETLGQKNILAYQSHSLALIDDYFKKNLVIFTTPIPIGIEEKYQKLIADFVAKRPYTKFYEDTTDLGRGMLFSDNHPNQKGHNQIAQDLFRYLTESKLIPCSSLY
ncbi:SGNH/GDSL hydrolase family protein [Candidatus Gottesmanbacteria bacterium]|nr:SGNH/GDSL hydrolase family protein [Candidatus Gottesmanbacteria bacterium]